MCPFPTGPIGSMRQKRVSEGAILRKTREILTSHKGKKNGIHSRDMADELGIHEKDTFIRTRSYIDKATRRFELPIAATTNGGYFFITNPSELFEYLGSLEGRIIEIRNKGRIVYRNYVKLYGAPPSDQENV